jgi:hypothetical protein
LLRVEDAAGLKINQWYTAAQLGCGGGTGFCTITPDAALVKGAAQAWVQTYGDATGDGPWSDPRASTVR